MFSPSKSLKEAQYGREISDISTHEAMLQNLYVESSLLPSVCTDASCSSCWDDSLRPQQREAGSTAAGPAVPPLFSDNVMCGKRLFVRYLDAWWVRISITTQYNNISVIIKHLGETFWDFSCLV